MSIQQGDTVPAAAFKQITETGIADIDTGALFKGRKVAVFGLPGAYTPRLFGRPPARLRRAGSELEGQGLRRHCLHLGQ